MLLKIKHQNITFLRVFIQYGIHLWLLIFISNVAIFYSVRFFLRASTTQPANIRKLSQVMESPSVTPGMPTPIPTAIGPVVDLSFSLPGIGTNGGNLKPERQVRDVSIYLYDPDSNTSDKTVKPVYRIKTQAIYDDDPNSSRYTFFVNKYADLGAIKEGKYQIAIQTSSTLQSIIKSPGDKEVGGKLFELYTRRHYVLPPQSMISGDIYPDNFMDINDYNWLVNCFSVQTNSQKCADKTVGDIDDNGVVDGIDYNIMLMNFRVLASMGLPVPTISIVPSDAPKKISPPISKPTSNIKKLLSPTPTGVKVSPSPAKLSSKSKGAPGTIIIFILFVLVIGIFAFVIYKFHLFRRLFNKKNEVQNTSAPPEQADMDTASSDMTEKSGYLKIVSVDTKENGTWVTLADDNGVIKGFYPSTNVSDGFVKVKGTMKNDQENKPYIFITQLSQETS